MRLIDTYGTPAELTGYVRAALRDYDVNQFQLSQWLPNDNVPDIQFRFLKGTGGLVEAASYRAYDAESDLGDREGVTRVTGELPPISRKIRLSEYDYLRQAQLDGQIRQAVETDAERLMRQIAARLEVARGEALYDGKVTINERGVIATVDFGRTAGHSNVAPGTLWSDVANADPLTDMINWRQTYIDTNGVAPGVALTSTANKLLLLRNEAIRDLYPGAAGSQPSRISDAVLSGILGDFGLPPIVTYDVQVKVNGSATRIIPANRFLYLPSSAEPLGTTCYGVTAEAREFPSLVGSDEAGIVAAAYSDEDPVGIWTKAAAIAIPLVANPDLTFEAIVTA